MKRVVDRSSPAAKAVRGRTPVEWTDQQMRPQTNRMAEPTQETSKHEWIDTTLERLSNQASSRRGAGQ